MSRRLAVVSLIAVAVAGGPRAAGAEELRTADVLAAQAEIFANQVRDRLDMVEIGDYTAGELIAGTGLDYELDMVFDVRARKARITFGGGDDRFLALRVDARLRFERGLPRLRGRLDLGVAGTRVTLNLPEISVRPRSYQGEVYLEYQIPILEAKF